MLSLLKTYAHQEVEFIGDVNKELQQNLLTF